MRQKSGNYVGLEEFQEFIQYNGLSGELLAIKSRY